MSTPYIYVRRTTAFITRMLCDQTNATFQCVHTKNNVASKANTHLVSVQPLCDYVASLRDISLHGLRWGVLLLYWLNEWLYDILIMHTDYIMPEII